MAFFNSTSQYNKVPQDILDSF